jgi:hypothetical protein
MANNDSVGPKPSPRASTRFRLALKEKWEITIGTRLLGVLLDIQVSKNVSEIMLTLKART